LSSVDIFGQGGSSDAHFANKGEGVNFSRFCADVFYERPLIKITSYWSLFAHVFISLLAQFAILLRLSFANILPSETIFKSTSSRWR